MKGKLKIVVPLVALVALFGAYKTVLAKPAEVKHKVEGEVYILPKEFVLNLADGRFAKVGVALVLEPGALEEGGHGGGAKPPEGFGPLPQEALVRDIVVDTVTSRSADDLTRREGREALKKRILKSITTHTDVHAEHVVFTDVAVQ